MKRPGWIAVVAFVVIVASGAPWAESLAAERQETRLDRQQSGRTAQRLSGSISDRVAPAQPVQRPHHWELLEALPAPLNRLEPDAQVVDVAAEAAATPPRGDDLGDTIDVQITQEIMDLAAELATPQAMYEFVRNGFEFQPYYGSRKGAVDTLHQRSGNDYDLASLLIALLRAEGFPARYAEGQVEMTVDQVTSWLAVDDAEVAGSVLFTNGMEGISIIGAGSGTGCCEAHGTAGCDDAVVEACVCALDTFCCNVAWDATCVNEVEEFGCGVCTPIVVAVRAQRVWVEAWVPHGMGSPTWVPLDPTFKLAEIHPGMDIPQEMALDAQAFIEDYWDPADPGVTLPRPETPVELLELTIADYLDTNHPGTTLEDVARTHEIVDEDLGILPGSLPYTVRSRDGEFSEIPADRRYQVRFHLYDGGTTLIDHTVNLPEVSGKRITLSYEGATSGDQTTIESFNGLLYTPPNLIDLRPVLKVEGQAVATGAASIGAGRAHSSDMHFLAPSNAGGLPQNVVPAIFNSIVAGELQAIGLAVQGVFNPIFMPEEETDTEIFIARERFSKAMSYLERNIQADDRLASLMLAKVTQDVGNAILKDDILVSYDIFDNPTAWEWRGLTVDADRLVIGVWKVDQFESGCGGEGKDVLVIGGAAGSLNESLIYETDYSQEAVSTIKILQLAVDQGITVYKRWNTLPLPANTQPFSVRSAIQTAIAGGNEVTFPADPLTYFNWTGTGYIDMDPCNGAAGYIIAGGQNGGSTVDSWIDILWGDANCAVKCVQGRVTKPPTDSPDKDAVFCKTDTDPLKFEYDLRIENIVTAECPDQFGSWTSRKHTSLSPKQLAPDNYNLIVGDKGEQGDDQHIRKLTIVELEILDKDKNSTDKLKVAKWKDGISGSPGSVKNNFIDLDPDRFFIRVNDQSKKGDGMVSIGLSTESPGSSYDDNLTEIELDESTPGVFESKSLMLMSDNEDDDHQVDSVADDAKNDRSHKIALDGKAKARYPDTGDLICEDEAAVSKDESVQVDIVILRDKAQASGGTQVISTAAVTSQWNIVKERYAQLGVEVTWSGPTVVDPPAGVDLTDGLTVRTPSSSKDVTAEAKALIDAHGTGNSTADIHVFYVNDVKAGTGNLGGTAIADFYYNESEDDYTYNVLLTDSTNSPWNARAAAHELGHLLTNAGHVSDKWRIMASGVLQTGVTGAKRWVESEETKIKGDSHVQ